RPLLERRAQPLGEVLRALDVRAREEDRELLAAPARDVVNLSYRLEDGLGELPQDEVAGRMPVAVVDRLEVVEVGEDQRERIAEPLGPPQLLPQDLMAPAAVREAGQAVAGRLALDDRVQAGVLERDHA